MIDLHCHILPNIDDGAKDIDESLAMCEVALKDGVSIIVASPHINPSIYEPSKELILSKLNKINEILKTKNGKIKGLKILAGAENRVHPDLIDWIYNGKLCTINNNMRYIILELPDWFLFPHIKELIIHLKARNIISLISHPERNLHIRKNINLLYELVNTGALSQITAMSITGEFGYEIKQFSKKLLRRNLGHIIVSDAHSAYKRPPVLSRAVEEAAKIVGSEKALNMVTTTPKAIIDGKTVEFPKVTPRRKFFRKFSLI